MQMDNKLFDDFAKIAAGAFTTFAGMREEMEAQLRQQLERILGRMDLVTREEFEAVREMAETARTEQEALAARVAELESRLAPTDAGSPAPADEAEPPDTASDTAPGTA